MYLNRSTFSTIKYMYLSFIFESKVYDWGRFPNTGSHIRTTIYPKLSPDSVGILKTPRVMMLSDPDEAQTIKFPLKMWMFFEV